MDNLDQYRRVASGIASLLHPHAEVVVHDLATQQVVHLENNYSNREIGSPSHLEEIDFKEGEQVIGPYRKVNWDGRILKSISIVMAGTDGAAEALICINMDISELDRLNQVLGGLLGTGPMSESGEAMFKDDWHERINIAIQDWLSSHNATLSGLSRIDKRTLVLALRDQGAFKASGSAPYVARCLGLARATVYNYLKED